MNILFVSGEAFPFCKTGGLADVAGSLPVALAEGGERVAVILPLYRQIAEAWRGQMEFRRFIYVDLSWRHQYCGLFSLEYRGVTWYFVDNEYYFRRERLYGEYDDGERFAFFSRAVVELLPSLDHMPDVIHCNDWQTALVPVYLKDSAARWDGVRRIRTVFTVHNIEYQGRFGSEIVDDLLGLDAGWWQDGTLRLDGDVNLMKAALLVSDEVTTVSPTYAMQLHDAAYAHGMEQIIDLIGGKLRGVLNGIDTVSYDPETDGALPYRFSAAAAAGKTRCKAALQTELGLSAEKDTPIVALVSRLVGHKGMDLVCRAFDELMTLGVQVALLGTGERCYESFFAAKARQYPGRAAAELRYDEGLSRRIYAGSDLFLMPSRSEPCGLSQMIAMRYGAVPIVRKTGGLADSVRSCQAGQPDGTGFLFDRCDAQDMLFALRQAVELYRGDPKRFRSVRKNGMNADFSWRASAKLYRQIYSQ